MGKMCISYFKYRTQLTFLFIFILQEREINNQLLYSYTLSTVYK